MNNTSWYGDQFLWKKLTEKQHATNIQILCVVKINFEPVSSVLLIS